MGVAPRAADGVELATRPSFPFLALAVLTPVYATGNLAVAISRTGTDGATPWVPLLLAIVLGACSPVCIRVGRSALAAQRAGKAALSPGVGRMPVSVEPVFFASTRWWRPKFRLRIRSDEGRLIGTVRSGHLRLGVDPTRFTVLVGGRTYGASVALETLDGRIRLLPGSALAPDESGEAPWSRRATDLFGWTAPGDPLLLARASEVRADRIRIAKITSVVAIVLILMLWTPFGLAALIALFALMAVRATVMRQRAQRAMTPEIRRVAPDVGPELHSIVAQLVLRDPGAPFPTGAPSGAPLPPPPSVPPVDPVEA